MIKAVQLREITNEAKLNKKYNTDKERIESIESILIRTAKNGDNVAGFDSLNEEEAVYLLFYGYSVEFVDNIAYVSW